MCAITPDRRNLLPDAVRPDFVLPTKRQLGKMVVTTEQREQFEREGYLIFDPELSHTTLDNIISDLAGEYKESGPATDVAYRSEGRIQDAWRINPHARAVAVAPKTLSLLEELY